MAFVHLHNHTQYSMLDGACRIDKMIALAKEYNMPAVAMTDHGNMFGTIDFYNKAKKAGIKPIIGYEAYVINSELDDENNRKDKRHHLVLLAQNLQGYQNLMKISSYAFTQGFYYRPRISKSLLKKHSEGLIALSACIQGEIPRMLIDGKPEEAEKALDWFLETYPGRFYIELQDHGLEEEKIAGPLLINLANKKNVPLVVTNDCHYLKKEDYEAHDVLLCIQTGKSYHDENRMRFDSKELYFKTEDEMAGLFPEVPEAITNTVEIAEQIDLELNYDDFLFPRVDTIPDECDTPEKEKQWLGQNIKELCYNQVPVRYGEINDEIKERLDFELDVIHKMGYDSYFLIVKDFIDAARQRGIPVGPGRGSAAGSIVAYLLDITQLDPLKYDLLFERFLDVERVGMPDIDIDFCAEGRGEIIDYVVEKYGRESVTQIVTFGKLGAKSVIKDVARTMDVPPSEANAITKLMPDSMKLTIEKALKESPEFKQKMESTPVLRSVLKYATVLEGLIRQIGIHAAGVVIGPGDLSDFVPLAIGKSRDGGKPAVLVQYEGKWLDDLKMLKMDFLGLQTLTHIKKTCQLIKKTKGIDVDMANVPLDDLPTYELLSNGQTDGVFQFESKGMKRYLSELKPNVFEDLIAMVALFRPGPMQFIPSFIARKNGEEKITYDHPLMESSLKPTYGITVYQEQVMQISKKMANFTSGEAGTLRKAIGKKKEDLMAKMEVKFKNGCTENGVPKATSEKIWEDWKSFANYAFNKSHAACYGYVAYQTAYLKANYPLEFMSALLTLEDNPSKIPYFIEECNNMGIEVTPPLINTSDKEFSVRNGKISFGLRGIKNVGDAAIAEILRERDENGEYKSLLDLCTRVNGMTVNKATIESLICAGALDDLDGHRAQQYAGVIPAIEYAQNKQAEENSGQLSIFDTFMEEEEKEEYLPQLPDVEEWGLNERLENEKLVLGYYISGHPLQKWSTSIRYFSNANSKNGIEKSGEIKIFGIVSSISDRTTQRNKPYSFITLEDMQGKFEIILFGDDFTKFRQRFVDGEVYYIEGTKNQNGDENTLKLRPAKVIGIDNISKNLSGTCTISGLPAESFNKHFHNELTNLCKNNPGSFNLFFNQVNLKNYNKKISLKPHKYSLFPSQDVIAFLESLDGEFSIS